MDEEDESTEANEPQPDGAVSPTLDGQESEPLLHEPPPPPVPKEVLQEIDLTPFIRSDPPSPLHHVPLIRNSAF